MIIRCFMPGETIEPVLELQTVGGIARLAQRPSSWNMAGEDLPGAAAWRHGPCARSFFGGLVSLVAVGLAGGAADAAAPAATFGSRPTP